MSVKTITVGEKSLTVQQVYPYQYNFGEGKEVLRIDILKSNHDYAAISAALENPTTDTITYCEDGVEVCLYKGYMRDFRCAYADGMFSVEITRITQSELDIASLKEQIASLQEMVHQVLSEEVQK
ncbi:hypothetical protein [Caproiciproducens galactitolivorans]|uniref:hypothetical protein n=1 Tax=Caproiciproducens galactitolivorans TaxID=642589 RepID=UPI00240A4F3D|nr:hypothetical protein [Caproiciproducens galactitolivorans]